MQILILVASNRQPAWVDEAYQEFAKRFRTGCTLEFREISLARRSVASQSKKVLADEGQRMLRAIPVGAHVVALAEHGKSWSTEEL